MACVVCSILSRQIITAFHSLKNIYRLLRGVGLRNKDVFMIEFITVLWAEQSLIDISHKHY